MADPIEIFKTKVTTAADALALINGVFQWAFGPNEPSITFPFLNWADTANDLWRQRNADDNGWVVRGRLSEAFLGMVPVDDNLSPLVSNGNYIINPRFEIAQRGTSFNVVGYGLDRWRTHSLGGGAATISQQSFALGQTAVPDNPKKYLQWNQTGAAPTEPELQQRIEYVDTLAGQTCTVIFWAKADAERTMKVGFRQSFGTGSSPSSDVDVTNQQIQLTANWQKFTLTFSLPSVSGKVLGTGNNDYLALRFLMPMNTAFTIDIANVIVAKGINIKTCRWRMIGQEITLCQRYYETGVFSQYMPWGATTNWKTGVVYYKVQKRISPTIIVSVDGVNGRVRLSDGVGSYSTNIVITSGDYLNLFEAGITSSELLVHLAFTWTADAEL
jgi:hypothetical protein